jgi:hypothetical protein
MPQRTHRDDALPAETSKATSGSIDVSNARNSSGSIGRRLDENPAKQLSTGAAVAERV